ncbi:metal ABC transporter permease [Candidatus Peregrinibacteria bacterium]|nr:metal ABC transporter permease [Candidatus Peregrinibacteria bacterium]
MIDRIFEAFTFDFFLRALFVGSVLSVLCALLGNFVVLRREAVVSHAISHVGLLGIALGILLGIDVNIALFFAVIAGVFIILFFLRSQRFSQDSVLEFIAEMSLAGSIVVVSQMSGYRIDLMQFLFGDILLISERDVWFTVVLGFFVLFGLIFFHRPLSQALFNEELAKSAGVRVSLLHTFFLLLLAVVIAVGMKIIGALLLAAFLVIPPNTAKIFARNFRGMMIGSAVIAFIGTNIGLLGAYIFDVPSGAMVVLVLGGMFLVSAVATVRF